MKNSTLLSEDFESIKEIKDLSNEILIYGGKINVNYIKRQINDGNYIHLYPVKLIDVYQQNPKKFLKLADFIINSKVSVYFTPSSNMRTKGNYGWTDEKEYDKTRSRSIKLFYDNNLIDSFKKKVEEYKDIDYKDIYFTFYYAFENTLIHEIQHAYDDYRSGSKIFRAKKNVNYLNKYELPNGEEVSLGDENKEQQKYKEYLNLQHEIWARFSQAISKTRFYNADFGKTSDNKDYLFYHMNPITNTLKDFKNNFIGWNVLTNSMKKKLYTKASQYWHKEQDLLPEKNKKELEKTENKRQELELNEIRNIIKKTIQEHVLPRI